jgi:hypothetical protein
MTMDSHNLGYRSMSFPRFGYPIAPFTFQDSWKTTFADGHHDFGGDYYDMPIWIHILAATWQVTNQSLGRTLIESWLGNQHQLMCRAAGSEAIYSYGHNDQLATNLVAEGPHKSVVGSHKSVVEEVCRSPVVVVQMAPLVQDTEEGAGVELHHRMAEVRQGGTLVRTSSVDRVCVVRWNSRVEGNEKHGGDSIEIRDGAQNARRAASESVPAHGLTGS